MMSQGITGNFPFRTPRQTWPTDTPSWPPTFSKYIRDIIPTVSVHKTLNNLWPIFTLFIFLALSAFLILIVFISKSRNCRRRNNRKKDFSFGEDIHLMEDISDNSPPHPVA